MKNIPFIVKIAVKPLLIIVLLVALSITGFSRAFYEIGSLTEERAKAVKSENILKSKLDTLSESQANVTADANYAVSFFPGENPALLLLYQLRTSAAGYGLILSNLKVNPEAKDANGFLKTSIAFDILGPLQQILDFVNSTKAISPNVWIEKTELNFAGEGDSLQASIYLKSYWSPFPTKIPALVEPITSLDASEKEILSKMSGYSLPPFVTLTPGMPRENLNPFGE